MGIHKYKGNKRHTFREFNESCAWCNRTSKNGFKFVLVNEKHKGHSVELPYCSPKCLNEDTRFGQEYFESIVLNFLDTDGEREFRKQEISMNIERKKRKVERENEEKKIEEEKRKAKNWKPIGFIIGVLLGLLLFKLFGVI